jgi:drug/metabolite transporter (DMT)-like permease
MSIATAAGPAITIIVAWLIISERPRSLQIIGVVFAAAGMLSLIAKGSLINVYHLDINWGDLLVATAVIAWSFYSVFLRKFNIKIDPLSLLTVTIVLGTLFILPFYIGEVIVTRTFSISFRVIPIILFLGIFPSLLSYFWWNNGVAKIGAGTSAMFFYLLPVFAAIMAFLFLGEDIRLFHIIGAILIFLGLYLSINKQKNRQ